jgi:farnesyl-diphosphate farnesyltransferase
MTPALYELLQRTSRTFALTIPLLEEPLRGEVAAAYLCFRIADSLEDEAAWPKAARIDALEAFARAIATSPPLPAAVADFQARVRARAPLAEASCRELVAETEAVLAALAGGDTVAAACILHHVRRTTVGMAESVAQTDAGGVVRLVDVPALRHYCYLVAGIVGEMLTELFLHHEPLLRPAEAELRGLARTFGEGLQLVNILKDEGADATAGRYFLPRDVARSELFSLARGDLAGARRYVEALHGARASRGSVAFCALPVLLAEAALDAVEARGPGAKVPRTQVMETWSRLESALDAGRLPF